MKRSLLKNVLDGLLAVSAVLSLYFFVQYYFTSKQLRTAQSNVQMEAAKYQNNRGFLTQLVNETLEYAKTHPDMSRVLEPYISGRPAGAPAPNVPKPGGK